MNVLGFDMLMIVGIRLNHAWIRVVCWKIYTMICLIFISENFCSWAWHCSWWTWWRWWNFISRIAFDPLECFIRTCMCLFKTRFWLAAWGAHARFWLAKAAFKWNATFSCWRANLNWHLVRFQPVPFISNVLADFLLSLHVFMYILYIFFIFSPSLKNS